MDCEQLIRLVKEWGMQVKQETMAIARMRLFVDQHIKKCPVCSKDLIMPDELEKIYRYLAPESAKNIATAPKEPDPEVEVEPQDEDEEEFAGEVGDGGELDLEGEDDEV